ncbi:MAG: glycerate kinase, partial [Proteobacteria bacterium]|nr:glycerate kinase [Pseudomonadota bacterium]
TGFERLFVIAAGKAAYSMCKAVEETLGDIINEGVAITKYDHGGELERIKLYEASHPLPDENGIIATREVIDLLENADEDTLVLCLISGGGSSLLVSPCDGITLEDKKKTTNLLLRAGADIKDLNCVRKHLSKVKGGRLAEIAAPASVISFILSDVIGDSLDVIASGPTVPDSSNYLDALRVMEKYEIRDQTPPSVLNMLSAGSIGLVGDTPKAGDEMFCRVKNDIICNIMSALEGAKLKAEELGFITEIRSSRIEGEAREAALTLADFAIKKKKSGGGNKPLCFISGGETTVHVKGQGKGGRNMEFALAFAERIKGIEGIALLSAGTDGTDGPTDAAGAIVDGQSDVIAQQEGCDMKVYLNNNDSYSFFEKTEGLLITGPTGTNVMDIQIVLIN